MSDSIELAPLPPAGTEPRPANSDNSELAANELAPVDGGRQAWLFLLSAFVMECTTWGYSSTYGVIEVFLARNEPFQRAGMASITSVGTISLGLQFVLPAGTVLLFRRFPHRARQMLWMALVVSCGSMLASSWATKVWQLIVLQGVLGGTSAAVLYTPVLIWLQEWFVERRGMASGIIFAGTGIGGFIFPFMVGALLEKVGFAWTVRIWALFTLVAFAGSIVTLRPRIPVTTQRPAKFAPVDMSWVSSPTVILMCITAFIAGLSYYPVALYIPTYTASLGSPIKTTIALAILNASNTIGSVLSGSLSDRYSYSMLMMVMGVVSSATAFLSWGFADSLGKTYAFALLFGLFSGNTSLWNAVSRDVAGTNIQTSSLVFCAFCIARGVASIVGPVIASSLYHQADAGLSTSWGRFGFREVIIFVGTSAIASAVGGAWMAALSGIKIRSSMKNH